MSRCHGRKADLHMTLQLLLSELLVDPFDFELVDLLLVQTIIDRVTILLQSTQLVGYAIIVHSKLGGFEQQAERRSFGHVDSFGACVR